MTRIFKSILVMAAAAVAFASCQREDNPAVGNERTVRFFAGPVTTRTVFTTPDATGEYPVLWTENDTKVKVALNMIAGVDATVDPAEDGLSAKFEASFSTDNAEAPYRFFALSPATAFVSANKTYKNWGIQILADQTPGLGTPDETAMVLAGNSDSSYSLDEEINLDFNHVTAYGRMTLTNLDLTGVAVSGVSITAEQPLAGRFYLYVEDTDEHEAGDIVANSTSNTINLTTSETRELWFACAPADLSNTSLKVTVYTASGVIEKTVSIPANRRLESGHIAKFNVDMTGATTGESKEYELVTDAAQLTEGSEIIIANAAGDHAVGTTQNTNNRSATGVTVENSKIVNPAETVDIFAVEAGTAVGTFAFKGKDGKYLVSEDGANRLKSSDEKTALGSFTVSIDADGLTTVNATASGRGNMRYNENSGNPIFNCYATSSTTGTPVAIYKLAGSGTDDPIFQATLVGADEQGLLTVPATTTSATINVIANVEWEIYGDEGITFSEEYGISSATVTATFPANETDQEVVWTINVESELGTEYEFVITQEAKVDVPPTETVSIPYEEDFSTDLGKFVVQDVTLPSAISAIWTRATYNESSYAKATSYESAGKKNYEGESWLISPLIDLTSLEVGTTVTLSFQHCVNKYFGTIADEATLWTREEDGEWTQVAITYPTVASGKSFSDWATVNVDLTEYVGKNAQVAFKYIGHSTTAGTWEVDDFSVFAGAAPLETVATPTFSPAAGEVEEGTEVTISCATEGATIYYTTDGSVPTASSTEGSSVIITEDMTIKAIAVKEGMNDSEVAEAAYTVSTGAIVWTKKALSAITASDVFVIVGNNGSNYAMSNDNGTGSAPSAVAVAVASDGNSLSGTPAANLQWNLTVSDGAYTFYPNGVSDKWLYVTNTNNGVRVGTGDNKTFTLSSEGYLYNAALTRYMGIYSSQDWRCYTSINSNIKDQTFAFFVKTSGGDEPPVVIETVATPTFDPAAGEVEEGTVVTISCATAGATIHYTTDGSTPTASSTAGTSVTVNAAMTIKAIAMKEGMNDSAVAEAAYTIQSTTPPSGDGWYKKALSAITASDVFVIVGNNGSNYAMSNDNGTGSAPSAVAVAVASDGNSLSGTPAANLQWNLTVSDGAYTFYPNGVSDKWLYVTNTNNGVRVGTGENNAFTLSSEGYLYVAALTRYMGIYSSQDWRTYTTINANIKDQTFAFFVKSGSGGGDEPPVVIETVATPTFSPAAGAVDAGTTVTISCATAGATIHYTTDGSTPTASSTAGSSVTVNAAMTLKAIAVKDGMNDSAVAEANYTIKSVTPPSGDEVTDVLTASDFVATTSTTYEVSTGITKESGAVYGGNSATNYDAIQIRSKNSNSGIVSTASGGDLKAVKVVFNSNTQDARELQIYGSTSAYSSAENLYGTSAGTLIGTLKKSDGATQTLNVTDAYQYVGIRSKDGAIYLDSVEITWD